MWGTLLTIGGMLIGANSKRKQAKKSNAYSDEMYDLFDDYQDLKESDLNRQETQIGLDNNLLNYQSDYITNNRAQLRQQLDLDRAQLNLQGLGVGLQQSGLDMQATNIKARMGLYDGMIDQRQSMTEAVKQQTMQALNANFEGMSIQKQQIEAQHQQQSAVRSIQALRDRAGLMVTTGEASVGGSSVQRAVFQLANDEAMQQAQMSSKTQNLVTSLSVQARSQQMQAGNTISNALRQGLMAKMNMLNSKNGIIGQLINNRQAKLKTYLDKAGLQTAGKELALGFDMKMDGLNLEQYKLGYQQDLNELKYDRLEDEHTKLELDAEKAEIENRYGEVSYGFANMFAEVAPSAYYIGKNEEWW